jgi:uroporphyrin-III C-methyltransferase/precorrin-2 dehydrogenase/sirohydrochlorin ferrochelatase
MLRVAGEPCLVVGGGKVALQKARALCRAGARVIAVSPEFLPAFERLKIDRIRRRFRPSDVAHKILVVAGTDDMEVNRSVYRACRKRSLPVNVVDAPELCSFIVPSILRRGPVTVAVSTGGLSPSLAKALRKHLETLLPASIERLALRLGAERGKIMRRIPSSSARTRILKGLVKRLRIGTR